jgi:RNA polymerase sigma-70 factor (ECF subfamily)
MGRLRKMSSDGEAGDGPERPSAPADDAREARPVQLPTAVYPGWDAIYDDNVTRLYRLMHSKVGNRPDAEDLTSQVFVAALKSLRPTATIGEVRAYLLATARTVLAGHWQRTLGRQVTLIDVDATDLDGFTQPASSQSSNKAVDHATRILAALPERHRRILVLRFLHGYSIREAAAEMDITVTNAKVLQHRALRKAAGLDPEWSELRPADSE